MPEGSSSGRPGKGAGTVQQPRRAAELEDFLKGHKSVCLKGLELSAMGRQKVAPRSGGVKKRSVP